MDLLFRSRLDPTHRPALERLMFFNPRQNVAEDGISHSIELYGAPAIIEDTDGIGVTVGTLPDPQCFFALRPRPTGEELLGAVLFTRTSVRQMVLVHIAVADCDGPTRRASFLVVLALIRAVRSAAHRLRGVERLSMPYRFDRCFGIRIRQPLETGR